MLHLQVSYRHSEDRIVFTDRYAYEKSAQFSGRVVTSDSSMLDIFSASMMNAIQ